MKGPELRAARLALGLTAGGFARMVGLDRAESDRTVRHWEAGDRGIPGPVAVILEMIEAVPGAREWLLAKAGATSRPAAVD